MRQEYDVIDTTDTAFYGVGLEFPVISILGSYGLGDQMYFYIWLN